MTLVCSLFHFSCASCRKNGYRSATCRSSRRRVRGCTVILKHNICYALRRQVGTLLLCVVFYLIERYVGSSFQCLPKKKTVLMCWVVKPQISHCCVTISEFRAALFCHSYFISHTDTRGRADDAYMYDTRLLFVSFQLCFLSQERVSFGNVPLFSKARRLSIITNRSLEHTVSYRWHITNVNDVKVT